MSEIRKHWVTHAAREKSGVAMAPYVECVDGFMMSVQASKYHLCSPRTLLRLGEYTSWEAAYPSRPEPLLEPYRDQYVPRISFANVPTAVIDKIIRQHGGIKRAVTPARKREEEAPDVAEAVDL